jgi:hypothetical protein
MLASDVETATHACKQFVERYLDELHRRGFDANWNGQDVSISHDPQAAASYIAKGLSWEIAGGSSHKTKPRLAGSLTPFDIARKAAAGSEVMRYLWSEYAKAMPGTRSCVITASLAKNLGICSEDDADSDASNAAEPVDVVGTIPTTNWNVILRRGLAPRLLGDLETRDPGAWPEIRAWAVKVSTELSADDIPYDYGPPVAISAPTSRSELACTIARVALETIPGQHFIQSEISRMNNDWQKFGGPNPLEMSEVVRCLSKVSREAAVSL